MGKYNQLTNHRNLDQLEFVQPRSSAFVYTVVSTVLTVAYAAAPCWRAARYKSDEQEFEYWKIGGLFYDPVFFGNPPAHVVEKSPLTYIGWGQCSPSTQESCKYLVISQVCAGIAFLLGLGAVQRARVSSRKRCLQGGVLSIWTAMLSAVPLALYLLSEEYKQLEESNVFFYQASSAAIGHLLPEVFQGSPGRVEYFPFFAGQGIVILAIVCNLIAAGLFFAEFAKRDEFEYDEAEEIARHRIKKLNHSLKPSAMYDESPFM